VGGVKLDARMGLFVTMVAVFVTCIVGGNLIGGKLTAFTDPIFGREWSFSTGELAFPMTFILTDIINEFYGRKVARMVTLIAFTMVGITLAFVAWADAMPWWGEQLSWPQGVKPTHWETVFSQSMWIQVASMIAFIIGNLLDISVFFLLKRATGNRFLWLRATGSTAVSQLIDTFVILWIAFDFPSTEAYLSVVFGSYAVKLFAAVLVTPIIYAIHAFIERVFHLEPAPPEVASADISS
jgi:queuosine precursor transporter